MGARNYNVELTWRILLFSLEHMLRKTESKQLMITSATHWLWWHIIRIPTLRRLRKVDC